MRSAYTPIKKLVGEETPADYLSEKKLDVFLAEVMGELAES